MNEVLGNQDVDVHRALTYGDLILAALRRFPERVAFRSGELETSYADMDDAIRRFRRFFVSQGLGRGDAVALLSGNQPDAFAVMAAAVLQGCRYTPLHPAGSIDDHLYVLDHSAADVLLYEAPTFDSHVAEVQKRNPGIVARAIAAASANPDLDHAGSRASATVGLPDVGENDISHLSYTGGTTGRPKGVARSHRCMVTSALGAIAEWEWPEEIRFLVTTPLSHGAGVMVLPVLMQGGTISLLERFSPSAFVDTVEADQITCTFLVPTLLYRLLDSEEADAGRLRSLETVIYGAAPISATRLAEALDRYGRIFMQLYGQSEAPNLISVLRRDEHVLDVPGRLASCGRPVSIATVKILDPSGDECDVNEVGEICVRGSLVMAGYWREPELTSEAFANGWLHTGDLARRDQHGFLTIVDRAKDMIISGGFNVFAREVEDVIASHAEVSSVAVFGVPHPDWGEAVSAAVVRKHDGTVAQDELISLVRRQKGAIWAPKIVVFREALPLTAVGKPDKKALRRDFLEEAQRASRGPTTLGAHE